VCMTPDLRHAPLKPTRNSDPKGGVQQKSIRPVNLSITHKLGLRVYDRFDLPRGNAGRDVQGAWARAFRRSVARSLSNLR
jgi:hypothetical protein